MTEALVIHRHRTAMIRHGLSQPVALLVRHGLVGLGTDLLDFGCGRGDDVRNLATNGVLATGWDPHFAPTTVPAPASVVNLGFVLNVVEDVAERRSALSAAWALTRKVLAVSVMLQGQAPVENLRAYGDGYVTTRQTFQKYFQQSEVREFVGSVTGVEPVSVAPGIFFVFRAPEDEQDFLFERRRGAQASVDAFRSTPTREARPFRERVASRTAAERVSDAVEEITAFAAGRGRLPHEDELTLAARERLARERVSLSRACEFACETGLGEGALARAAAVRREDLLVHQALGILNRSRTSETWSASLTRDVRALFGSRRQLADEALKYLFALSDAGRVEALCLDVVSAGAGTRDDRGRFVMRGALIPDLAGPLRCYVGCGIHLAGEPDGPFLIRLDPPRKRLSFLTLASERAAFPVVTSSVVVDLRRQDVRFEANGKRLVRKSALYAGVSKRQVAVERRHAAANGLGGDIVFEPWSVEVATTREERPPRLARS